MGTVWWIDVSDEPMPWVVVMSDMKHFTLKVFDAQSFLLPLLKLMKLQLVALFSDPLHCISFLLEVPGINVPLMIFSASKF